MKRRRQWQIAVRFAALAGAANNVEQRHAHDGRPADRRRNSPYLHRHRTAPSQSMKQHEEAAGAGQRPLEPGLK